MKHLNQYISIITIIAFAFCNCVVAQTKTQTAITESGQKVILKNDGTWEYQTAPQNLPKANENAGVFDNKPFDLKVEKLPPNYKGHDADVLANTLVKWTIYKTNFEKIESLRARYKELEKDLNADLSKQMGAVNIDSIFAFQVSELLTEYDSKSKLLAPSFAVEDIFFRANLAYNYKDIENPKGSYVGQNAYGAKTTVTTVEKEIVQILSTNGERFLLPTSRVLKYMGASFEMDEATASQAKTNMKALIICKLVEPYTKIKDDTIEPTLSSPQRTIYNLKGLVSEIIEIWYYDTITGKIYYKQKPK